MVKQVQQNKLSGNNERVDIEQNTIFDDSLLPSADELAKLNAVSKEIVPWIMKRTEVEQNARIRFNDEKMQLAKDDHKHIRSYNFVSLVMAFLIVVMFLVASFYLIMNGKEIIGSIFGGSTLVLLVSYFVGRGKRR